MPNFCSVLLISINQNICHIVDNRNILDKKEVNKQLDEEDILETNFTDLKNDTTRKEKRDFSRNIKYVND